MKISAVKRGFALLLTTVLTAGVLLPGLPAKAAPADDNVVTLTAKDDLTHKVHWAYGIQGPAIPQDFSGEGPLLLPFDPKGGWYDFEAGDKDREDGAAAAVNMLSWWLNHNQDGLNAYLAKNPVLEDAYEGKAASPEKIKDFLQVPTTNQLSDSPLYGLFDRKAGEKAYPPDSYADFFLNGYSLNEKENTPTVFDPKDPEGGYLLPAFGMSTMTHRIQDLGTFQELGEELKTWLGDDSAIVLGLRLEDGSTRYVNLWGAEFDDQDRLTAVYVTDSLDGSDETDAMVRYPVTPAEETQVQLLDLKNKKNPGFTWENVYTLASGADLLELYEVPVEPQWGEPEYEWAEDRKLCTATREQSNGDMVDYDESVKVESTQTKAPTDKKPGEITHVATFSADWAKPQTLSEPIPANETKWGEVQYKWSEDNKTCMAFRISTEDDSIRQTTDMLEAAATEAEGRITYTVDFGARDEKWSWAGKTEKTVDAPRQEPTYGEVKYTWSEDNASCTASMTDSEGSTYSAQASVSSETTKKPGCETKGEQTIIASFTEDWAKTQTKVLEIKALGHDWGEPSYRWSDSNKHCDAVRFCKRDESHKEHATLKNVTAKQTKDPTEKETGEKTFTATFTEDWAKTQTMVVEIPVLSNNWGEVTYTWSSDNRKCTAKRVNQDDPNRVQEAHAAVSFRRTKEPTETQKGETTYEARFKEAWAKDQKKTVADVPSIKDDSKNDSLWNEPTYEWSKDHDRCTASRSKKSDPSTVDMAQATITQKEIRKATCQEPGETEFTATFRESWAKTQKETVKVTEGAHDLEEVPETPATSGTVGLKAHYKCRLCGKLFLDENAVQEVTREELELQAPAMAGNNALVEGIPEKENTVAILPDAIEKALKDHPEAKGIQINVGNATVVYTRETAQAVLKDAKNARKLVLQVRLTNFSDSGMSQKQALAAQKNTNSSFYHVSLTDGRHDLQAPCTVMVPYQPVGAGQTLVYRMEEKGGFQQTNSQYNSGFLAWNADTGYFMASEYQPVAGKGKSNAGLIIGIVVLVISFLGFLGIGGYFLYKKFNDGDEEDFSDGPQLDQAARERIRAGATGVLPKVPQQPVVQPSAPRPQPAPQQPKVAPKAAAPKSQTVEPLPDLAAAAAKAGVYQGAFESSEKPSYADKAVQQAHHSHKAPAAPEAESDDELDALKHWLDEIE